MKNYDKEIMKQSKMLAKLLSKSSFIKSLLDGYFVGFYNGKAVLGSSHGDCFYKADKKFGNKPFVISEVNKKQPFISSLVKIK